MTDYDESRLDTLIIEAHRRVDSAVREYVTEFRDRRNRGRSLAGVALLYSGGNDSTVLAHLFRERVTHAIHANTTIGIEQTRQFVRDTCAAWSIDLLEKTAPVSYRELVLEHGFPGPAHHYKMWQRLKERGIRAAKREIVHRPQSERVVMLAGRRAAESQRRTTRAEVGEIQFVEVVDGAVWVSPLLGWTALDMNAYRRRFPDCPRNPVSDMLHMSGECLCGSFAGPDELDEIGFWFPEKKAEIEQLERDALAAGNAPPERCKWGWGAHRDKSRARSGPACSSCALRTNPTEVA